MTDTSGYRVRPRWFVNTGSDQLADALIVSHEPCGEELLLTESVSVQTLVEIAARHAVKCPKHGT